MEVKNEYVDENSLEVEEEGTGTDDRKKRAVLKKVIETHQRLVAIVTNEPEWWDDDSLKHWAKIFHPDAPTVQAAVWEELEKKYPSWKRGMTLLVELLCNPEELRSYAKWHDFQCLRNAVNYAWMKKFTLLRYAE